MSISDYKEKKLLDHANNVASWTAPTTQYLALFKANPTDLDSINEVSPVVDDTAYARQTIAFAAATLGTGLAASSTAQTFAATVYGTGAAAYTVTHLGIFDAIGTGVVAAGSFIVGRRYTIKTPGTTTFTSIGAANNNAGTQFIATGVGSGTGDAYDAGNLLDYGALDASILRVTAKTLVFDIGAITSEID
ncbi:b-glycanase [Caudoviricetes sp.]|nr:b-glycanase [Caudoviricetes sp.]